MSWTPDRREEAKRLWKAGYSASQIARKLGGGLTRNAVIGVVHRAGLSGRATASAPKRVATGHAIPNRTPRKGAGRLAAVKAATARPKPEPKPAPKPRTFGPGTFALAPMNRTEEPAAPRAVVNKAQAFAPLPGSEPVPFMSRRWRQCAWPVDETAGADMTVCGLQVPDDDGPRFCAHHREAARNKRAKPKSTKELIRSLRRWAA